MSTTNETRKKVTLQFDVEVLRKVDDYAKRNGISRSGAFSVLSMHALSTMDSLNAVTSMSELFQRLADAEEEKAKSSK